MTPDEILSELEARQVELRVTGDRLRLRPVSRVPDFLLDALRSHKAEVMEALSLRGWPPASREAVREYGSLHARLYPLVKREVTTPCGRGQLIAVTPDRAVVRLAGGEFAFLPSEVGPPGVPVQAEDHFETVH